MHFYGIDCSAGRRGGGEPEQSARRKEGSWSTALEESRLEFHRHAFVFHRLLHRSDQDARVAPL